MSNFIDTKCLHIGIFLALVVYMPSDHYWSECVVEALAVEKAAPLLQWLSHLVFILPVTSMVDYNLSFDLDGVVFTNHEKGVSLLQCLSILVVFFPVTSIVDCNLSFDLEGVVFTNGE